MGQAREFAQPPDKRYNGGMIETRRPLTPEPWAPAPAPEPASLLEQLATLPLENAALRAQNATL
jgi:hypothetical protein